MSLHSKVPEYLIGFALHPEEEEEEEWLQLPQ
jgi:hypothetical protein